MLTLSRPQQKLLDTVRRLAAELNLPTYLAGGFVRDQLLGLPPGDLDFVVEGEAPRLARAVAQALGGTITTHTPFGTATWAGPDGAAFDFATARTETYAQPAALPVVAPASIADDLRRRDFTINALAVRVDGMHWGEVLDLHGGQADLAAQTIRVLHPLSFQDDPTRLFRVVRYEQRLGFAIAPDTLALIQSAWDSLSVLTGDRLWHEFELIFREPKATAMLARLAQLDILRHAHPALNWTVGQSARAAVILTLPVAEWQLGIAPEPGALYLALLVQEATPQQTAEALTRLNVNRELSEAVQSATSFKLNATRPSTVVAQLEPLSELAVIATYVLHDDWRPPLNDYLARWRFVHADTTGDDLIARGLTPGPAFKNILWQLRAARLDGEVRHAAEERALLSRLIEPN